MALTDNLVSYWKLDESSGNAADATGGGNTGTNNNTITYAAGKINNGSVLNGSNQYFSFPNCPQTGNGSFTVTMWINGDSFTGRHEVFGFGTGSTRQGVTMNINASAQMGADFYGDATSAVTGSSTLSTGTWYFLAYTFDTSDDKLRAYLNTNIEGTGGAVASNIVSAGTNAIGRTFWASAYYFDGMIDEVGVWSRVLSGTELTALYNGGAGLQYPFASGPANLKSLNTNVKANIKSINTNPIANVKSLNTNV